MTDRHHPARPIVGVGAVVLDGDRVLLVRRGREPLKGEWNLPGGAVEVGETLTEAVVREVSEETGLAIDVGPVIEVFDRITRDVEGRIAYHFVIVDFACRASGGTLAAGSDVDDAVWVDLRVLDSYRVTAKAMEVIERGRELLAPASRAPAR